MPKGHAEDVQAALHGALSTDAGVLALVAASAVFDDPPQSADGGFSVWPHIAVGKVIFTRWDTMREPGFDFVARIHVRSKSSGELEAKRIQAAIYARLHRTTVFGLMDHRLIDLQFETEDVTRVQDGTFHGVSEYRGLIETL